MPGTFRLMTCGLVVSAITALSAVGQSPPTNGMREAEQRVHAITGATVVVGPGQTIENATILIRNGVIEAVGINAAPPPGARIWPGDELTVYPGLIDSAVLIDTGDPPKGAGAHWNGRIHPQVGIADQLPPGKSVRKDLRSLGFTAAAFYPEKGILRGSGAVISLNENDADILTYLDESAMLVGLEYGGRSSGGSGYPSSLMGAIAILRQTLYDAQWHAASQLVWEEHPQGNEPPEQNDALAALDDVLSADQAVLLDGSDELNAMRLLRIASEFSLKPMVLGSGMEFRRLDEVAAAGAPIIVPLNFPKRPTLTSLNDADNISLRQLMTWEQAPTNARRLMSAGVPIALTTHRLDSRKDFLGALRKAIKMGLTEDDALAALTTTPAALLGLDHVLGTIEPGKAANLVVVDGSLFEKDAEIRDVWINGRRHEINGTPALKLVSSATFITSDGMQRKAKIDTTKPSLSIEGSDGKKVKAKKVVFQHDRLSAVIDGKIFDTEGYAHLTGTLTDGVVMGMGSLPDGERFRFQLTPTEDDPTDDDADDEEADDEGDEDENAEDDEAKVDPIAGQWSGTIDGDQMQGVPFTMTLNREGNAFSGTITMMDMPADVVDGVYDESSGSIAFGVDFGGIRVNFKGAIEDGGLAGTFLSDMFTAEVSAAHVVTSGGEDEEDIESEPPPEELVYPLGAYGLAAPPEPMTVVIRNATIWTCGPDGTLENADIFVEDGKIKSIGELGPFPSGVIEIDATGKHISPGLIDCHSHTGVNGSVNEFAQVNSAEVRIADVINPDDINWYRQLAGGLTAANQLHGSANPIGGQNSVVKIKWSGGASAFPVSNALPGIKFALGENVVRSQSRYPNTRMGVETIFRDAFTAAREYREEWDRYLALSNGLRNRTMPPRRDLELDTLVEILDGRRIIHCHSYRQDEILMLIRVAEEFGFTIGTFQHVLEGYKVAEAIASHGAGASSFSDWWAYKVEVMDAIPYNGAIMHDLGVVVSFNSDSSELARRMNTEAAKAVRYGGVDPHEALKFVTLNPARQLRIDHRTGSLEVGKDADFVIWSDRPLSTYARCEQTWIEGARYFDLEQDQQLRQIAHDERQRLVQKALAAALGEPTKPDSGEDVTATASADDAGNGRSTARRRWIEEQLRLGRDPQQMHPGDCGCGIFWNHQAQEGK